MTKMINFVLIPVIATLSGIFIIPMQEGYNIWPHGIAFTVIFTAWSVFCGIFEI